MPQSVTPKELEQLLNGLLQNEERLPYGFYIDTQELAGSLGAHLHEHEVGFSWNAVVSWSADLHEQEVGRLLCCPPGGPS